MVSDGCLLRQIFHFFHSPRLPAHSVRVLAQRNRKSVTRRSAVEPVLAEEDTTPVGLVDGVVQGPWEAASRQPRALGRNRVAVEGKRSTDGREPGVAAVAKADRANRSACFKAFSSARCVRRPRPTEERVRRQPRTRNAGRVSQSRPTHPARAASKGRVGLTHPAHMPGSGLRPTSLRSCPNHLQAFGGFAGPALRTDRPILSRF